MCYAVESATPENLSMALECANFLDEIDSDHLQSEHVLSEESCIKLSWRAIVSAMELYSDSVCRDDPMGTAINLEFAYAIQDFFSRTPTDEGEGGGGAETIAPIEASTFEASSDDSREDRVSDPKRAKSSCIVPFPAGVYFAKFNSTPPVPFK